MICKPHALLKTNGEEIAILANGLPRFLRVQEVADLLRCQKRTIYDMVEQQRIPYRRVGKRLLFDAEEIIEWTKLKD
jgi:excisionase family DNA binding protein